MILRTRSLIDHLFRGHIPTRPFFMLVSVSAILPKCNRFIECTPLYDLLCLWNITALPFVSTWKQIPSGYKDVVVLKHVQCSCWMLNISQCQRLYVVRCYIERNGICTPTHAALHLRCLCSRHWLRQTEALWKNVFLNCAFSEWAGAIIKQRCAGSVYREKELLYKDVMKPISVGRGSSHCTSCANESTLIL